MLTKILAGAILFLMLALGFYVKQANDLRETNAKQSVVIVDLQASLVEKGVAIENLNSSIAVFVAETEKINTKNVKLSKQLNKIQGDLNVKTWLNSMPDSVDSWLWKNFGKSEIRKVQNKSRVPKTNARSGIRKRQTLTYIKNLNTALASCNRDKAAARAQNN